MNDETLFEKYAASYSDKIGIYYCGKRVRTQNHTYGPEIRTHFLIVLVEKGRAVLHHGGKNTEFGEGDMLVMFPDEKIFYTAKSEWSIKWIGISGEKIEETFNKLKITRKSPIFRPANYYKLSKIFSMLYDLDYNSSFQAKFKAQSLLYDFFAELFSEKSIKYTDIAASAARIMRYNYSSALTVKEIADKFFLDAAYFSRLFKKEMGITPKKYILQLRIKRAAELLENTNYKINEISNTVGFEDPLYFSALFSKEMGTAPTQYRKQHKSGL